MGPDTFSRLGPLLADSSHWLSEVANSRYAPESRRSKDVNFNKLKGRKRPEGANRTLGYWTAANYPKKNLVEPFLESALNSVHALSH